MALIGENWSKSDCIDFIQEQIVKILDNRDKIERACILNESIFALTKSMEQDILDEDDVCTFMKSLTIAYKDRFGANRYVSAHWEPFLIQNLGELYWEDLK